MPTAPSRPSPVAAAEAASPQPSGPAGAARALMQRSDPDAALGPRWNEGQREARLYKGGAPGVARFQVTARGLRGIPLAQHTSLKRGAEADPDER